MEIGGGCSSIRALPLIEALPSDDFHVFSWHSRPRRRIATRGGEHRIYSAGYGRVEHIPALLLSAGNSNHSHNKERKFSAKELRGD